MKAIIQKILFYYMRALMKLHRPTVIAITGSVGKTTIRSFVSKVLEDQPKVMKRSKNFNSEIGLPLYVLDMEPPATINNPIAWLIILIKGVFKVLFFANKIMVVEMGADKPGDIEYLCRMLPPEIGIVNAAHNVHTENYTQENTVLIEKMTLAKRAQRVFINFDEDNLVNEAEDLEIDATYYGTDIAADVHVVSDGLDRILRYGSEKSEEFRSNVVGYPADVAMAAAAAVGYSFGMTTWQIVKKLKQLEATPGRMNVLTGSLGVTILDDTYNASAKAVEQGLKTLRSVHGSKEGQMVAVLGSMNELGKEAEDMHRYVGDAVVEARPDLLVLQGDMAKKWIGAQAQKKGFKKSAIKVFDDPYSTGEFVACLGLGGKDTVLFKGSQGGVFLEEAMKPLLNAEDESKLVRQSDSWLKKKQDTFSKEAI